MEDEEVVEEHISTQNEEQTVLHNLLLNFSHLIESGGISDAPFSELVKAIFDEFMAVNPEPINPTREYTLRWSDVIKTSDGAEEVIHYEISYEPVQIQSMIEKETEKRGIRETTRHLASYRRIREDDPILSETCAICYDAYSVGQYKRKLDKCGHSFHKKCVDKWFVSHPNLNCPMCRTNYNNQNETVISANISNS